MDELQADITLLLPIHIDTHHTLELYWGCLDRNGYRISVKPRCVMIDSTLWLVGALEAEILKMSIVPSGGPLVVKVELLAKFIPANGHDTLLLSKDWAFELLDDLVGEVGSHHVGTYEQDKATSSAIVEFGQLLQIFDLLWKTRFCFCAV